MIDISRLKQAIADIPTEVPDMRASVGKTIKVMEPDLSPVPQVEIQPDSSVPKNWLTGGINTVNSDPTSYINMLDEANRLHQDLIKSITNG